MALRLLPSAHQECNVLPNTQALKKHSRQNGCTHSFRQIGVDCVEHREHQSPSPDASPFLYRQTPSGETVQLFIPLHRPSSARSCCCCCLQETEAAERQTQQERAKHQRGTGCDGQLCAINSCTSPF